MTAWVNYYPAAMPGCKLCRHEYEDHNHDGPRSVCCGSPSVPDTDYCGKCHDLTTFELCFRCGCTGYEEEDD